MRTKKIKPASWRASFSHEATMEKSLREKAEEQAKIEKARKEFLARGKLITHLPPEQEKKRYAALDSVSRGTTAIDNLVPDEGKTEGEKKC